MTVKSDRLAGMSGTGTFATRSDDVPECRGAATELREVGWRL